MGKSVQPELKSLEDYVSVLVFNEADEHHNGAAKERKDIAEKDIHFHGLFLRLDVLSGLVFFYLPDAESGGNNGESIECGGNKIKVICVINKPHANGKNHHPFEFDDIFAVNHPGEDGSCKNRKPGNRVKVYRSKGENNGKNDEKDFERYGSFEEEKNKVAQNAYHRCNNSAHAAEKIVRNSHKGELNALCAKDFVFIFDKTDEHHHGAGNDRNYIRNNNSQNYTSG